MAKTFDQLRDEAMADPKRRAAIEREKKALLRRVDRYARENGEPMERLRKS
jgi:hypothetical protein